MTLRPTIANPTPKEFRYDEIHEIYRRLCAGDHAAIVGVSSSGKSNLVKLLARADVRKLHLHPDDAPFFVVIELNPHLMVDTSDHSSARYGDSWRGYELMLSRLRRKLITDHQEAIPLPASPDDDPLLLRQIDRYYADLFNERLAHVGVRQLENALYKLLDLDERWRIVFLFDELEQFFTELPPNFFQSLRGLRDEHKTRILYATVSDRPMRAVIDEMYEHDAIGLKTMQGFSDLFHGATHYLRLLDRFSAIRTIEGLEDRHGKRLSDEMRNQLYRITGGHAGLIRRGFAPAANAASLQSLPEALLANTGINDDCRTIINSLSEDERHTLRQVVMKQPIRNPAAWASLLSKQIVHEPNGVKSSAIPILGAWMLSQRD